MMNAKELERLEHRLLAERERVIRALANFEDWTKEATLEEAGELSTYPFHPADDGTATMEQEKEYLLASKEGRLLYEIDAALRTLYREPERYGRCDECGTAITYERLELVPWTRLCVNCQRRAEERQELAA